MDAELIVIQELLPTETTSFLVQFFVMTLLVIVAHSPPIKPLATLGTHELLQVQVRFHMALVRVFPWEAFLAEFTVKLLQPRMDRFPVIKAV